MSEMIAIQLFVPLEDEAIDAAAEESWLDFRQCAAEAGVEWDAEVADASRALLVAGFAAGALWREGEVRGQIRQALQTADLIAKTGGKA